MRSQKYDALFSLSSANFKRCTGVKREVFTTMVELVSANEKRRKKKAGRTPKVTLENQILMTLEYYREYRTFFHIGLDYGLHESNVQRTIEKIETILLQSGQFSLPGKKALTSTTQFDVILTDATESPAYRPKKNPPQTADKTLQQAETKIFWQEEKAHQ